MDITFTQWLRMVDRIVQKQCGLGIYDLPDAPYRDMYEDGLEPADMADIVLEEVQEHYPY